MPPKYKYFSEAEAEGMDEDLMAGLDLARGKCGFPFKKLSGRRTEEENKRAGGMPNSTHLSGHAMDIECLDANKRFLMVKALMEVGFRRIEVSKDGHVHVDNGGAGYAQDWLGIE